MDPRERSNGIWHRSKVAKFAYFRCVSSPKINARAEPDTEEVGRRPVHQIHIEIILKIWGI